MSAQSDTDGIGIDARDYDHFFLHNLQSVRGNAAWYLNHRFIGKGGNPIQLLHWKVQALQHVHFLIGKGYQKYRALQTVGDGIGQSIETLRDWEKSIVGDDDFRMELIAAQVAGEYEAELDSKSPADLRKLANEYHRNMSDIERARYTLRKLRANPLNAVKSGIRRERQSSGGRKRLSDTRKKGH